jgi:hypothetical protein
MSLHIAHTVVVRGKPDHSQKVVVTLVDGHTIELHDSRRSSPNNLGCFELSTASYTNEARQWLRRAQQDILNNISTKEVRDDQARRWAIMRLEGPEPMVGEVTEGKPLCLYFPRPGHHEKHTVFNFGGSNILSIEIVHVTAGVNA